MKAQRTIKVTEDGRSYGAARTGPGIMFADPSLALEYLDRLGAMVQAAVDEVEDLGDGQDNLFRIDIEFDSVHASPTVTVSWQETL